MFVPFSIIKRTKNIKRTLCISFLLFSLVSAKAETIIISCYDQLRDYTITFNTVNGILIWQSDLASTQFNIKKVEKNKDGIYVWGNTKNYGNDYFLRIGKSVSIKYFYGNHSMAEDPCVHVSTLKD